MCLAFGGQKVKGQDPSSQWPEKPGEYNVFLTTGANFIQFRPGPGDIVISLSGQKVKRSRSQQSEA